MGFADNRWLIGLPLLQHADGFVDRSSFVLFSTVREIANRNTSVSHYHAAPLLRKIYVVHDVCLLYKCCCKVHYVSGFIKSSNCLCVCASLLLSSILSLPLSPLSLFLSYISFGFMIFVCFCALYFFATIFYGE